jgi:glycosyltransferase involved in cell wall biosynthesis
VPSTRTLLTLLPVLPFDPAGGAQRSIDEIARMLAREGWRCTTLATTRSDSAHPPDLHALLASRGITPHLDRTDSSSTLRFRDGDVDYTLLEVGSAANRDWPNQPDPHFDRLLETTLRAIKPDVVHTYGASRVERQRQALCRQHGAAVVMGVRNHGYYDTGAFEHADAVLTCSQFLSDRYRERIGIESTPLPVPMDWEATLSPAREPVFVVYVNPSLDKGVLFFARLADELAKQRPDIPMLVFESRGSAGTLLAAGAAGGLDLRRHESIMVSPGVPLARDVFAAARLLLVPSCWEEPAGRVIVEAMINGVPPLVADRGGMPETVGAGGFVLPLPADYTPGSRDLPSVQSVQPWLDRIIQLCDGQAAYASASAAARAAAEAWRPEQLGPRFDGFFRAVRRRP